MTDPTSSSTTTTRSSADPAASVGQIEVRFFAAARAAAGTSTAAVEVGADATVADVLDAATARHPGLRAVLPRCSFLLDQVAVHGRGTPIAGATTLDVLPPFAGG